MALVETPAIVLHAFDYLETSRIVRLVTREAGLQAVVARGARRSKQRFGPALDLFAEGVAEIHTKPGRELQSLASFDVMRARPAIGEEMSRFTAAAMLAELVLRFGADVSDVLYDVVSASLDALAVAPDELAPAIGAATAWSLVAVLGFAPAVDVCALCHDEIAPECAVRFSHRAGGALCEPCGRAAVGARTLPADARRTLADWLVGAPAVPPAAPAVRAHQRLLLEFLHEHLADGRPLRAFDVWARDRWALASLNPIPAQ